MAWGRHSLRWWPGAALGCAIAALGSACTDWPATLTQLIEARRIASEIRVQFTRGTDASNRAVMAETDEASTAAAREAQEATKVVEQKVAELAPILTSLGYSHELAQLDAFRAKLTDYLSVDREILPLAVENTNLKAQRLAAGAGQQAADDFRDSVQAASRPAGAAGEGLAAQARASVLEIQVLQSRHIPEADSGAMTRMEAQMTASEAAARQTLARMKAQLPATAATPLGAASAALDRFMAVNAEILTLSRRNSNVRSLALALGRKRTVTAECDDALRALEDALAKHAFTATR